jgi:predicted HTH domain antitoxin
METLTLAKEGKTNKADWLVFSEALLRLGHFISLDELLNTAIESFLQQLAPNLRWKIASELYVSEKISSGRAAEIAGLNYFVFEEKLGEQGLDFYAAHSTTETLKEKRKALIHAGFNLSSS